MSPAPGGAPPSPGCWKGPLADAHPILKIQILPIWGPSASGHDGKCVFFPSRWLSLEECNAVKTPSRFLPGWVMGLCPFQGMAGCDCVPVSLSLTSLLPKQPGEPAQDTFSGGSVDLKMKPSGREGSLSVKMLLELGWFYGDVWVRLGLSLPFLPHVPGSPTTGFQPTARCWSAPGSPKCWQPAGKG